MPAPLKDATLDSVMARVPASRLPQHPLIVTAEEDRVRHARGQSFPDWLAMRTGDFEFFPDGVAYPETSAQVRELLVFAVQHDFIVIPYRGGASVAGHITPQKSTKAILTIDMGRMNQLMDLNEESQIATFGAGTPGPQVEAQLQARGYTLVPESRINRAGYYFFLGWRSPPGELWRTEPFERKA